MTENRFCGHALYLLAVGHFEDGRELETENAFLGHLHDIHSLHIEVCVCVCMRERERERECVCVQERECMCARKRVCV